MALEQVTVEYNLALEKAKAQFEAFVKTVQQGEKKVVEGAVTTSKTITAEEEKAHSKRKAIRAQEEQQLTEIQKKRKKAYSPDEIVQYNKTIEETSKRVKAVTSETQNLQKGNGNLITSFKSIAGAVGIAFGVQELLAFGKELLEIGRKSQGVTKAFNAIGSSQDLAALRASTGFGVSDLQLKQLAVRANTFKISLETLPTLLKFATVRAAETGQEVDYLVNSIIDGIGRQSPLILDNLGISAKDLQEEFKKTGDFAGAVGNIITKEMGNSVTSIDEATSETQKLSASWANFQESLAGSVAPALNSALGQINNFLKARNEAVATQTSTTAEELKLSLQVFTDYGDNLIKVYTDKLQQGLKVDASVLKNVEQLRNLLDTSAEQYKALRDEVGNFTELNQFEAKIAEITNLMKPFEEQGLTASKGYLSLATSLKLVQQSMTNLGKTVTPATETLKYLNEQLSVLKDQFENTDINSPLFRTLQAEIKALEERIESIVNPTNKGSIAALEKEISKLSEEQKKLNTTTEASIKKYADLQTKINELQRKISELKRLGDPLEKFNIEAVGKEIEISNQQLKDLEYIMQGIADKTLTAADMLKRFDSEVKNLKKSTGDASIGGFLTEDTIKRQQEFSQILTESITTLFNDVTGLFSAIGAQQDEAINRQLEGERTRAQEHFDIMKSIWQAQVEGGQITKEEQFNQETAYNEKINALEAKQAEIRRQQLRKQAIAEKANASFQLIIGTATSVAKNLANPPAIIAILALAAAQLAIIAATPIPEFAKGVVGLQGAGTETSDSIHAKLSKGESVITAKATRANKDALTAMNNGEYEKFVAQKYIMPALEVRREKQRNSFAENISRSMQSSTYDDSLLIHETRKNKAVSIRNADQIGKATARELGRNSYFKNRV
jgi:chromosome segregation ATPase